MRVTVVRGLRANDPPVHKLAVSLARGGHRVTVLEWDRDAVLPEFEAHSGYASRRFRLRAPYGKLTVLLRLPFWQTYQCYYLLRNRADVIHACDFDTLLPAVLVKLLKRTKLCYTVFDFYSDFPGRVPRVIRRTVDCVERYALRFVDCLFMVNEAMYAEMSAARVKRVVYIYNCPEDHARDRDLRSQAESAQVTLYYAGSLSNTRGIRFMLDAVRNLQDTRLVLAGTGTDAEIRDITDEDMIASGRLQYLGWIPHEEVIAGEMRADILFYFADPKTLNGRYASPNKLFEAMMLGKSIIVNEGSFMTEVVERERCGVAVPFGDIAAIRAAVVELRDNPELRQTLGRNGRNAYERQYNWDAMEKRLLEAYAMLAGKPYA